MKQQTFTFFWSIAACIVAATSFPITIGTAQPVLRSVQTISGHKVYQDLKQKNIFYLAPGNLRLATEGDGKPRFQLLEMRYTGTACAGTGQEKRFTNLVQLTIKMDGIDQAALENIRKQLPQRPTPTLRPIPIRNIESYLITPVGNDPEGRPTFETIGKGGSSEAASGSPSGSGTSGSPLGVGGGAGGSGGVYWTERTFTLKLENHEAQLLWNQLETGKLAMSFGYAFYADLVPGQLIDIDLSGTIDEEAKKEFDEEKFLQTEDTTAVTQLVKGAAFPIHIDLKRFPDAMKKVDINEEMPPAYAALEVKCYDFADELRPDLSIKSVEVEATAVNGRQVGLTTKFLRGQPDLHTRRISFPYAVRMDKPLRYRVTEFTNEGSRTAGAWQIFETCAGLLDVTTPLAQNLVEKKTVEVEIDPGSFEEGVRRAVFLVDYFLNEKPVRQQLEFLPGDAAPLQTLTFRFSKNQPVRWRVDWEMEDGKRVSGVALPLKEEYYFIKG